MTMTRRHRPSLRGFLAPLRTSWTCLVLSLLVASSLGSTSALAQVADEPFSAAARAQIRESTASDEQAFLVDTGSRLILPNERAGTWEGVHEKVFIQFEKPLRYQERLELTQAGVVFHEMFAPFTYLATLSQSGAAALERNPRFRGLAPITDSDKVTEGLYRGEIPEYAVRTGGKLSAFVRFYDGVGLDQALAVLDEIGIEAVDRSRLLFGGRLEVVALREELLAAAHAGLVRGVFEAPPPGGINNLQSGLVATVPLARALFGLDGSGVNIGIWDGGKVRNTHVDFANRVTFGETQKYCSEGSDLRSTSSTPCNGPSECSIGELCLPYNDHATHVAGTMIGRGIENAAAEGMAIGDNQLFSYNFHGAPTDEMKSAVDAHSIQLSNHSWGSALGWNDDGSIGGDPALFGAYDSSTSLFDEVVRETGHSLVKAAGNDGDDCDSFGLVCDGLLQGDGIWYDNIPHRGVAKNIITVGSVDDDLSLSSFSSVGPADDGRIKPDLVADGGFTLTSACSLANGDYCDKGGTSMATPVVSGTVALLTQQWLEFHDESGAALNSPPPELVKALLVNSAVDRGRFGPDYAYGFGAVDAASAAIIASAPNSPGSHNQFPNGYRIAFIDEGEQLEFDMTVDSVNGGSENVRTTLAWSDPPGTSAGIVRYCAAVTRQVCTNDSQCQGVCLPPACGPTQPCHIINDLDIHASNPLTGGAPSLELPWVPPGYANAAFPATLGFNHVDNVEKLQFNVAETGTVRLRVTGFSVPDGPQRFAVASSLPLTFLPPNDDFANARALPSLAPVDPMATDCAFGESPCPAALFKHNTFKSVNYDASTETGEPLGTTRQEHTVWFVWVAPHDGQATFDTGGADFDTILGAYAGSSVANLTELDWNDDVLGTRQSRISFEVFRGGIYHIAVSGNRNPRDRSMGVFPLNYYLAPNLSIGDVALDEGDTGTTSFDFTVSLSASQIPQVFVEYQAVPVSASSNDFEAQSGMLFFFPGEVTKTVSIPVNGDTAFEPDEIFFVTLSNPVGTTIADPIGVGAILNDDGLSPIFADGFESGSTSSWSGSVP